MDADTSPTLTPDDLHAAHAERLREIGIASGLYGNQRDIHGGKIAAEAYQKYIDQLVIDCGEPHDPLERILLEQLVLAHHAVARLHLRSGIAQQADESTAYAAAAAKLLGELRRLTLAVNEYRAAARSQVKLAAEEDPAARLPKKA